MWSEGACCSSRDVFLEQSRVRPSAWLCPCDGREVACGSAPGVPVESLEEFVRDHSMLDDFVEQRLPPLTQVVVPMFLQTASRDCISVCIPQVLCRFLFFGVLPTSMGR